MKRLIAGILAMLVLVCACGAHAEGISPPDLEGIDLPDTGDSGLPDVGGTEAPAAEPQAQASRISDQLAWSILPNGEGTAAVTGFYVPVSPGAYGSMGRGNAVYPKQLVFPETIDGYTITEIDFFCDELFIHQMTEGEWEPDPYGYFGRRYWDETVTSITVPRTVRRIGYASFANAHKVTEVILPEGLEEIGYAAFYECDQLETIVLPSTLRTIGDKAFYGCTALKAVVLPEGTELVGEEAFAGCTALETVTVQGGGTEIRDSAFTGITPEIRIAEREGTVREVLDGSYTVLRDGRTVTLLEIADAGQLPSPVRIPEGVTDLSAGALGDAAGTTLLLPSTLTGDIPMEEGARVAWEVAEGNPRYRAADGMLIDEPRHTLVAGNGDSRRAAVPDGVRVIGENAFTSLRLEEVVLPEGLDEIGRRAFYGCSLQAVVLPGSVRTIRAEAFAENSGLTEINFPESIREFSPDACRGTAIRTGYPASVLTPQNARDDLMHGVSSIGSSEDGLWVYSRLSDGSCAIVGFNPPENAKGTLKIPAEIRGIPVSVVAETTGGAVIQGYQSLVIPEGVRLVANGAFSGYYGLKKVQFPRSLTAVTRDAFHNCPELKLTPAQKEQMTDTDGNPDAVPCTYRVMPDGTAQIVQWYGRGDKTLEVPATVNGHPVTAILKNAFEYVDAETLVIPEGIRWIANGAFNGCRNLKKAVLPEGLRYLGPEAFFGCDKLADVSFPSTLAYIGDAAFGRASVREVVLPEGLAYLGWYAFANGGKLTRVSVPASAGKIRKGTFMNQPQLREAQIGEGITEIGAGAFAYSGLKEVVLPDSLTLIGMSAFTDCESLQSVRIGNGCETIGPQAFAYCSRLREVDLGSSVREIREGAFLGHGMREITLPASVERIDNSALFPKNTGGALKIVFAGDVPELDPIVLGAKNVNEKDLYPTNVTFVFPAEGTNAESVLRQYMAEKGLGDRQWKMTVQE